MGDAENTVEQEIMDEVVDAEILKVAHHGSQSSTSEAFLIQVTPEVSVISVGSDNPYGHPAPETIERLQQAGSAVYRTDQVGTISAIADGRTYRIETERPLLVPATTPGVTGTPSPAPGTAGAVCDCSSNRYNCGDFRCRPEAQACYDYCLSLGRGDIHQLDSNNDGRVCESLAAVCA